MVREFGLSPSIGPVGYPAGGSVFLGGGGSALSSRPYAEQTQAAIDAEVARVLREAEHRSVEILKEHRDVLDQLVELLLVEETVDGAKVYELAGRPGPEGGIGMTMAPERSISVPQRSGPSLPDAAAQGAKVAERELPA
jgi:cell division protease FtsH